MTTETSWKVTDEIKQQREEIHQEAIRSRQKYIERAKQLGKSLDATLVAITGFPPGIQSDPAVYRNNQDESYFMVAGKRGEVASTFDPEEMQKKAKWRVNLPLDYIGEYAIVRFDFQRRIEEDGVFYTPDGYLELKRYSRKSDPPLVTQGNTPSPIK